MAGLLSGSDQSWRRAAFLYSGLSRQKRQVLLNASRLGRVPIITCVNVFNEGVDVTDVNLIAFLRVTHSRRIFVQQLGRGLRLRPTRAGPYGRSLARRAQGGAVSDAKRPRLVLAGALAEIETRARRLSDAGGESWSSFKNWADRVDYGRLPLLRWAAPLLPGPGWSCHGPRTTPSTPGAAEEGPAQVAVTSSSWVCKGGRQNGRRGS